jgi:hypothetical protein
MKTTTQTWGSAGLRRALLLWLLAAASALAAWTIPTRTARCDTPVAGIESASLREGFSFQLKDCEVPQQGGNRLGVSVRYDYQHGIRSEDYPDFRLVARACEEFLSGYPDKKAFWEVVNKELTAVLLEKFPALASVTVEIQVPATSAIPYARSSTVTRHRDPR